MTSERAGRTVIRFARAVRPNGRNELHRTICSHQPSPWAVCTAHANGCQNDSLCGRAMQKARAKGLCELTLRKTRIYQGTSSPRGAPPSGAVTTKLGEFSKFPNIIKLSIRHLDWTHIYGSRGGLIWPIPIRKLSIPNTSCNVMISLAPATTPRSSVI